MKDKIYEAVKKATKLHEVKTNLFQVFETIKLENGSARIGYVSGIITSDGAQHIHRNIKTLNKHTELLREQQNFPLFSSIDVIPSEVFKKIEGKNITASEWMKFWRDILESGHVTDIFMTPRWEQSKGAIDEHEAAKQLGIKIHYMNNSKDRQKLNRSKSKIITICSSASFYKDVLDIQKQLRKLGFKVLIPQTANNMKKSGNFNVEHYKTWFRNKDDYKKKQSL